MASFLKNIFGRNKSSVNDSDNAEDHQMVLIQKWSKSQKSLENLDTLFNIQDENYIIKELINSKTVFKIKDEKDYSKLIGFIKQKENSFKNAKIVEIFFNIKEFDKIKTDIEVKQTEINRLIPDIDKSDISESNKKTKNDKVIHIAPLSKFDFEIQKYFFNNDNFMKLVYADKNQKARIYFGYVEFFINNVLNEDYIRSNFKDFYKHASLQKSKMNEFFEDNSYFVFSKVFNCIINKENYFEIIYNLFIDLENFKGDSQISGAIRICILLLIPNQFNYQEILSKKFIRCDSHLSFLFTNKDLSTMIKDKEFQLEFDIVNTLLNFLIDFESYVELNEKKPESTLMNNKAINKPGFFKVYDYLIEIISENQITKNVYSNVFGLKTEKEFDEMVFLHYVISLYKTFRMFNRNYNSRETINLENDEEIKKRGFEASKEDELIEKSPLIPDRKESLDAKNKLNLEKFLFSELDNSINDEVLAKEIFTTNPEEIKRDTNILNNFIDQIFNIVFVKNHLVEKFVNVDRTQTEILKAIDNNLIYNEKIKKLPTIILLKLIQMNSPINVLENFIKKSVDVDIDKEKKNGFLKFVCFSILKNSFEILSDKAENYPSLLERLELVNYFYDTSKLISSIKTKIEFLTAISKKSKLSSAKKINDNQQLPLKNIIFEEEKLKSYVNTNIKKNSASLNNIKNLFFNNSRDLKQFKFLSGIYDFILVNTNKFTTSKGIKFFKNFESEIASIDKYLQLVNQTAFPSKSSSTSYLTLVDFIFFFIKNEKLEISSLDLLKENVILN